MLRSLDTETLVIAGLTSSGVVLSTIRQAADLDYRLIVLDDLCMDLEPEIHEVLVKKIFAKQAQTFSAEEWMASLKHT